MTPSADFMDLSSTRSGAPAGANHLFRAVSTLFGAALVLAALGLWLVPGSSWSAELMLIKLSMTALFALGGLSFLQAGRLRR